MIDPTLVSQALVQSGLVAMPHDDPARVAHFPLCFLVTALGLAGFACWQSAGPWRPWRAGLVARTYVPLLVGWAVLLVGYLRAMHALGHPVPPQPGLAYFVEHGPQSLGFWIVTAGTVIAAPLAEELLFRGYLRTLLRHWLGPWTTIVVVAIAFGLLHGLAYALPIAALGVWFGWLRERCGALLPAILAHAMHNGVVILVTACWPQSLELLYPR